MQAYPYPNRAGPTGRTMVETVPLVVEIAVFAYLVIVGAVGCYLQARVWRGKRRQALESSRRSGGGTTE